MTTSGYQVSFYAKGLSWMSFVVETVGTGWTSLLASLIFSWSSTAKWPCSGPGFKLKLMRLVNVFLNMALFAIVLVVLVFMPGYYCILAVFLGCFFFLWLKDCIISQRWHCDSIYDWIFMLCDHCLRLFPWNGITYHCPTATFHLRRGTCEDCSVWL